MYTNKNVQTESCMCGQVAGRNSDRCLQQKLDLEKREGSCPVCSGYLVFLLGPCHPLPVSEGTSNSNCFETVKNLRSEHGTVSGTLPTPSEASPEPLEPYKARQNLLGFLFIWHSVLTFISALSTSKVSVAHLLCKALSKRFLCEAKAWLF